MSETRGDGGPESDPEVSHRRTFDPGEDDVVVAVLDAIASARGVDPTEIEPLTRAVDPDALMGLFSESPGAPGLRDGRVVFHHAGCVVTVTSDGHVRVRPPE